MPFTLISFDLDGTLVHTAPEIVAAANATLEGIGLPRRPTGEVTALIGNGARTLMLALLQAAKSRGEGRTAWDDEAVMRDFEANYLQAIGSGSRAYEHAIDALVRLRHHGIKLACVTNKAARHTQRVLEAHRMLELFDLVLSGDTLAAKKPHASVLRHVAQALACDLDAMAHVGDSMTDVDAARNAGVAAWAVPYGYNGGADIRDARPDRLFEHLGLVADHVLASHGGAGVVQSASPSRGA